MMAVAALPLLGAGAWVETFGRLHVAVVHFPIALLVVAAVVELWRRMFGKGEPSPTVRVCLVLGAVSAIAAAVTGWVHGSIVGLEGKGYERHQAVGIAAAVTCGVVLLLSFSGRWSRSALGTLSLLVCGLLVSVAGHYGGELTHGAGYLTELVWKAEESDTHAAAAPPAGVPVVNAVAGGSAIDFARDVRPILVENCYECHSSAKRRGGLSLDARSVAMKGGNSGASIVPGDVERSLLVQRVIGSTANKKQMPPNRPALKPEQIEILRKWVAAGAHWSDAPGADVPERPHWAFVKPARPMLPVVKDTYWPRNPIDYFVLSRLEKEGLKPSREADKRTLIRRVYLDLVGLPPKPEEVEAFVNDSRADAYERVVERLLDSPHYGERWGRHWLDLARYADTNGYEKDNTRSIWPYRDWVINAINRDLPFDEFAIEQLAGDMLPNATQEQVVATGFHRNTMFNEEGGIDVEEFRYKAVVDRVQTTGTAFLGLTLHCAQCHDHKYDPITHKDYFGFFGLLNGADEPTYDVKTVEVAAKRAEIEKQVAEAEAAYEEKFPAYDSLIDWQGGLQVTSAVAKSGSALSASADGTVLVAKAAALPEADEYTVELGPVTAEATHLRLEALTDPSLPKKGPGRAKNGNFVLTEIEATHPVAGEASPRKVKFVGAEADHSQPDFPVQAAIDGKADDNRGWAIHDPSGPLNKNRTATFKLAEKIPAGTAKVTVRMVFNYSKHSLGKFRLSLGRQQEPPAVVTAEMRREFLERKQVEWERATAGQCRNWTVLDPVAYERANEGTIEKLDDGSLLFTGDNYYREEYRLKYATNLAGITGMRIEVLPHPSQPKGGPGRNPNGGFLLSELAVTAERDATASSTLASTRPANVVEIADATATDGGDSVDRIYDGKRDTHWTIPSAGDGRPRVAVVRFKEKVGDGSPRTLGVSILQNYHQQENLGRVRISVTTEENPEASGVPAEVEALLRVPAGQRTAEQAAMVRKHFLATTPLLASERQRVAAMRASMPAFPTTLVMRERPRPRTTRLHHRGEYLQPGEPVAPAVPGVLPQLPAGAKADRLALARWIVSPENPLTARVVMNRTWSYYFGRGIVTTVDDFGTMGQLPTHPELLDWLATEFVRQGWSMKQMHRLIVNSATYRQSSVVTEELKHRDPLNALYARGPRFRVEAEVVRDVALSAAGLLSEKVGGPSVFPPQPAGVSDLSYGPIAWKTSEGEDRYRRGLYTFLKRTSPYPGLTTFDAPTSEVTCARRTTSNTPLQALTTLNDEVFVEAARAMGRRIAGLADKDVAGKVTLAFELCVARPPTEDEMRETVAFFERQMERFGKREGDAVKVALGAGAATRPAGTDVQTLAAWMTVSRVLLNLDETITKE